MEVRMEREFHLFQNLFNSGILFKIEGYEIGSNLPGNKLQYRLKRNKD